jgi:hypothetical protein
MLRESVHNRAPESSSLLVPCKAACVASMLGAYFACPPPCPVCWDTPYAFFQYS